MSRIKEVLGHSLKEQEQNRVDQNEEGEGRNGSNFNVDSHLSIHCKRYFDNRVEFSPARHPDTHLESLKDKYQPINTLDNKMDSTSDTPSTPLAVQSEIPKPKKVLFDPDCLLMNWTESRPIGSGLSNMGNTCFLNSVLQCLSYTPPLVNYILSGHHKNKCTHQGFCAMCEYHSHLVRVRKSTGVVKPIPIVHNLRVFAKHFRNGHQEDAHEFLRYFIDSLQRISLIGHQPSKLDVFSKHTTVIHQIFGGYHRSQVKCLKCKRFSNTYDPLLDISLDIKGCPSLQKALFSSIKPDLLDEENKYACPFCKELTRAKKQLTVHVLPKVLTIQLKRFEFNTMFGGKINKTVQYPEHLDMRPFMSDKEGPHEWYRLYAVLVHYGYSCHSGHYYCYVRNSNGVWYSMNDSMVNQVSKATVLSQQAYLLFYIKDSEYAGKTPSSTPTLLPFSPSQKNQPISSKVSATGVGVPVKRPDNEGVIPSPLTPSKPTGVVTPSPKYTSVPPPPSLTSDASIFNTGGSKKVELPALSNKPSPTPPVMPSPSDNPPLQPSIQTTPIPFSTPPRSTTSIKFTPRSVSTSKSKSVLSADETGKSVKPHALVQPMRSVTAKRPVARVLPSPQQVTKSDSTLSDQLESPASSTVCDKKLKENEESTHINGDNVDSSTQPSPAPTVNRDVEHDKKNEKDVKSSKDDDLAKTECESPKQDWVVSNSPSTSSLPTMFGPSLPPDYVQSSSPNNWTVSDMKERLVSRKKKHSHKKTASVSKASPDESSIESSDTSGGRKRGKDERHKEERRIKRKRDRLKEKEKNRSKEKDHIKEKKERDRSKSSKRDSVKEREEPKKREDSDNERDSSKHHKLSKKRRHRDRSSSDESDEEEIEKKRRKQTEHSHKKRKKHHSKRHHSRHSDSSDDESHDGRRKKRQKSPSPFTPPHSKQWKKSDDRSRGRDKDELFREKARRGMEEFRRMKESDKLFDDCLKNKGSTSVTEIKWDSKRSSRRHDSTSSGEPNVLDSLDKSDQLGDGVKTWSGEKNSIDSIKTSEIPSRRKGGRDDWDREIDRGKVKKSKGRHNESWDSRNKFQSYQNKKNFQNNKKF
ncbi:PREDICTED: ubiquitin carboxyl-terminal hydrolase 36-like [Amphimedon queenslandica]|uniref:Ubiquitin carboxyl-terminal hydrolase 36 n=1 Tax=Amphimedon queenslandica TaxID=400682 RepID=A0A1X7VU72_AMPQE|nr:PREDICTED: ubiquitin carboxyl-terminal hydrolase 36-like [Amphimedon queenslandica]|eukprot:XP_019853089.1 PREDICTED: ubiquitin carboxyl-terminal hydrolase 36-like [Amphimedon queenslandica]